MLGPRSNQQVDASREPKVGDVPRDGALAAFRSRSFTILWIGNLFSNTASWMQQVAEPWLVLRLSNSAVLLGLDSFALDLPIWLFILVGGVLADRRDRRRTALLLQSIQFVAPLAVVILLVTGHIRVWMIILMSLVVGITDALSTPSIAALIPSSVPEAQVASAIGLNSAQFNLSRVLGPLAAGAVMAAFGAVACFGANAISYLPFLLALYLVKPAPQPATSPEERGSLRSAIGTVIKTPGLRRAMLTVLATSFFAAPLVTFLPIIVRDGFHLGGGAFGGALSAFGVGGLFGAGLVLPMRANPRRQILASSASLALGVLVAGVAVSPSYPTFLVLVFLSGAALVASNTSVNSILQSSIDGHLRGRVASLYTLALRGGAPIGNLATGLVIAHFGTRALVINGILAVVAQTFVILLAGS
jgi:MFS family permease